MPFALRAGGQSSSPLEFFLQKILAWNLDAGMRTIAGDAVATEATDPLSALRVLVPMSGDQSTVLLLENSHRFIDSPEVCQAMLTQLMLGKQQGRHVVVLSPLVLLDSNAVVSDADSANFAAGKLTVRLTSNAQPTDRIAIRNQGVGAGQIGVSGINVTFGGVVIGTFTGGTGTAALVVTFNANATPARVQSLLRNINYRNTSATPSTLARTVQVTLTDGDGRTSNLPTKLIRVTL